MNIKVNLTFSFLLFFSICFGQQELVKPDLDTAMFDHWAYVREPAISADGNYAAYIIASGYSGPRTLAVKAVSNQWDMMVDHVSAYAFTDDGKHLIYQQQDTLTLYTLASKQQEKLYGIKSYRLLKNNHFNAILLETAEGGLSFRTLKNRSIISFKNVASYSYDKGLNNAVLLRKEGELESLSWLNLTNFNEQFICTMSSIGNIVWDKAGQQFVFIAVTDKGSRQEKAIYRYRTGDNKPQLLIREQLLNDTSFTLSGIARFGSDGGHIFYKLKEKPGPQRSDNAVQVDVWSYTDARLQSNQLKQPPNTEYIHIMDLNTHKTLRLQYPNESFLFFNDNIDSLGSITYNEGVEGERNWNPVAQSKNYLINCYTGERTEVDFRIMTISPDRRFIGGYDKELKDYYIYDINKQKLINLTGNLPVSAYGLKDIPSQERYRFSFADWCGSSTSLLLYDDFDIWKIDFQEGVIYENLTKSYGRTNNIIFRIEGEKMSGAFKMSNNFLLSAFNRTTKENGYFRLFLAKDALPEKLFMGPYHFDNQTSTGASSFFLLKAKKEDVWVVRREQANSSPNYYLTRDFKTFQSISHVAPEKNINWLTSELINYTSLDGKPLQGVLYKPENFDSTMKYPLIIHYYEKLSDNLHFYKHPEFAGDNINIPWMLSRGYLVFTPDIYYSIGKPGESAYNSVVGAADYLSRLRFVDSARMGLQGHSFGGYETNYIITRTNRFKAAVSASGISDFISGYADLMGSGESKQFFYEIHQCRIGASLWEKRDLFIENSPIFYAEKIKTPVLLMNNKLDGAVNFSQGVEFFTSLRRLGKPVWMLQYDMEGHSIVQKKNKIDFTFRMDQFFDYYLKGEPMIDWMKKGIPAKLKGLSKGY
jgi:dienelactone hydrolase